MPKLPIAKGDYERPDNPPIILVNMRYEADPANTEDQVSIAGRPALLLWKTNPNGGQTRGVFYTEGASRIASNISGDAGKIRGWIVPGGGLIAYTSGTISGDESCTLASTAVATDTAVIANGLGAYTTDYSTTTAIVLPDTFAATSVDASTNRYLLTRGASQRVYWSGLGDAVFDALDYASAELIPDQLVCVKVIGNEIWLFGRVSIEVWQPTADPDLPFQSILGRNFAYGCFDRATVAKLENTLFWVAREDRIVMMTGPNPIRISDPFIEAMLRQVPDSVVNGRPTITGFIASDENGHTYYVINLFQVFDGVSYQPPIASYAYDVKTGSWARWKTYGQEGFDGHYAAPFGDGRFLVGGATGQLNFLTADLYADNGLAIVQEWSAWLDLTANMRCTNIILDCSVGSNPSQLTEAYVEMRWSDDRGKTWNVWQSQPLGYAGDFSLTPIWTSVENQLGAMGRPGRLFSWRMSAALAFMVRTAKYNERP